MQKETHSVENIAHNSDINSLLTTLITALSTQLVAAEAELTQVKKLMDGAIEQIVDSFISLEASTRIAQNIVTQIIAKESNALDELNPFRDKHQQTAQLLKQSAAALSSLMHDAMQHEANCKKLLGFATGTANLTLVDELQHASQQLVAETKIVAANVTEIITENKHNIAMVAEEVAKTTAQIDKDVQTAVKSLQFQDMASQLIVQSVARQKMMLRLLNTIEKSLPNDNHNNKDQHWPTQMAEIEEALQQMNKVRMKAFNVDAGSVELF